MVLLDRLIEREVDAMFIKIEVYDGTAPMKTITYDAVRYSLERLTQEEDHAMEHARLVIDVGEQEERTMVVHCSSTELFIMNNNGATVDKVSWK